MTDSRALEDTRNLVDEYKGLEVPDIALQMAEKSFEFHIAIENLQHDFNIGSIVRSANAFNVGGVHIIGKRHWNKRGAMSTEKYLAVYYHADAGEFVDWASTHAFEIIGVDNVEGSVNLSNTDLPKKCVLVFGQEGPGISAEIQQVCTKLIAVEQFGSTRSVNVGAAAAIVMYEWVRRNHLETDNKKL